MKRLCAGVPSGNAKVQASALSGQVSASSIPDHQAPPPFAIVLDAPPDALAGYVNPSDAEGEGKKGFMGTEQNSKT